MRLVAPGSTNLFKPATKSMERGQWEKSGSVALVKITKEVANGAQRETEATQNGQQRRAILSAGWPTALGSGDFSRLWSKTT
jgi:hypothetical protein